MMIFFLYLICLKCKVKYAAVLSKPPGVVEGVECGTDSLSSWTASLCRASALILAI